MNTLKHTKPDNHSDDRGFTQTTFGKTEKPPFIHNPAMERGNDLANAIKEDSTWHQY
jgi:hypothetical protein